MLNNYFLFQKFLKSFNTYYVYRNLYEKNKRGALSVFGMYLTLVCLLICSYFVLAGKVGCDASRLCCVRFFQCSSEG